MSEGNMTSRRTVLKATGVTLGTAALGSAGYAANQSTASSPPRVDWERTFESSSESSTERGATIAQGTARGFGVSAHFGGYGEEALVKFGSDGTEQWTTNATEEGVVMPAPDGGFVVSYTTKNTDGTVGLLKADASGSVVRETTIDIPTTHAIVMDATPRPNGGYAIALSQDADRRGAWLLLVSEDGSRESYREYESRTDQYERAKDADGVTYSTFRAIAATEDGGYAFAGKVHYGRGAEPDEGVDAWVLRVTDATNPEWETTFDGGCFDVVELGDGSYAVTPGKGGDFGLSTISASGTVRETYSYSDASGYSQSLTQRSSNEIVLGNMDGPFLLGAAPTGEKNWSKQFDDTIHLEDLIATGDGGLAVTGAKETGQDSNDDGADETAGYVAKLSNDGTDETPTERETEPETEDDDSDTPTPTPPPATATEPGTETQTDEEDCEI